VGGILALLGGLGGTILFLMPGYILAKVYGRNVQAPEINGSTFVASSAIGGVITHLVMLGWTVPLAEALVSDARDGKGFLSVAHYLQSAVWIAAVLLLVPAVLGFALSWLTEAERPRWWAALMRRAGLASTLRTGQAWDWRFRSLQREGAWVRIRLKNDQGVFFGPFGTRSVASSDPRRRDIYLEEIWTVDERGDPVAQTNAGAWIAGDEILSIEFFEE
jgi:hypothetical protein